MPSHSNAANVSTTKMMNGFSRLEKKKKLGRFSARSRLTLAWARTFVTLIVEKQDSLMASFRANDNEEKAYLRTDRIFKRCEAWYFKRRNNTPSGPHASLAQLALSLNNQITLENQVARTKKTIAEFEKVQVEPERLNASYRTQQYEEPAPRKMDWCFLFIAMGTMIFFGELFSDFQPS